jgi:hypothetical protein
LDALTSEMRRLDSQADVSMTERRWRPCWPWPSPPSSCGLSSGLYSSGGSPEGR